MHKTILAFALTCAGLSAHAASLSAKDVAKIERYYIRNGTGDGDTYVIDSKELKGEAAADFRRLTRVKNCSSYGYCPEAYAIAAYGTPTLAVAVSDDGGIYIDVFSSEGKKILACSAGESEDMTCDEIK